MIQTGSFLLLFPLLVGSSECLTLLQRIYFHNILQVWSFGSRVFHREVRLSLGFYLHRHRPKLFGCRGVGLIIFIWEEAKNKFVPHLWILVILHSFGFIFQRPSLHFRVRWLDLTPLRHSGSFHAKSHLDVRARGLWQEKKILWFN